MAQALQAITHNFPAPLRELGESILGKKCYKTLVWDVDFGHQECLKLGISKGLGLGIVAGGAIVKLPQIVKIVSSKSVRGISLSSYLLDTASTGIAVAYNARHGFPFGTYGESVFLLAQNFIIIALIVVYTPGRSLGRLLSIFAVIAGAAYALSSSALVPLSTLQLLQASAIPLALTAKLPQIASNFRLGSTGQLSAFLVLNSLLGCLARLFTTSAETGDTLLFWSFALNSALNAVIALQMLAYWNKGAQPSQAQRQQELEKAVYANSPSASAAVAKASPRVAASPKVSSPTVTPKRYVRKLD